MARPLVCWNCGHSLDDVPRPISRHANCAACFEVLHCCRMCAHYTPGKQGDCAHDRADPPIHKESANFCDYFRPSNQSFDSVRGERSGTARSKLAALFDDEAGDDTAETDTPSEDTDDVRRKLDDLFDT